MRKAKKCNTGKQKLTMVWLALVVLFLVNFIRPVDVQAAKMKLNKSAVTINRGASTSLKVSGSKENCKKICNCGSEYEGAGFCIIPVSDRALFLAVKPVFGSIPEKLWQ